MGSDGGYDPVGKLKANFSAQRACDACRARKVRCDKGSPCSNCRSSKISCRTTQSQQQKVQKQRVLISNEYEKKIERIEDRLGGVERLLRVLVSKVGGDASTAANDEVEVSSNVSDDAEDDRESTSAGTSKLPFHGETTLNAHSSFAKDMLEHAVSSSPFAAQSEEMKSALASLRTIVNKQNEHMGDRLGSMTSNGPRRYSKSIIKRPPWELVSEVLQKAQEREPQCFIWFPVIQTNELINIVRDFYGDTESSSPPKGREMLIWAILYYLFTEYNTYNNTQEPRRDYKDQVDQCQINFEHVLSTLDLFMPANMENVMALICATSYLIETCRPSLCWIVNNAAASMCKTLGFHRISTIKDDPEDLRRSKIGCFWFVYMMDKQLSLRFGRASTIQDYDIALPSLEEELAITSIYSGVTLSYWIEFARIQGQTYDKLYSPQALSTTLAERTQAARELASQLKKCFSVRQGTYGDNGGLFPELAEMLYVCDVVMHYSTMTLIQRVIPAAPNEGSGRFTAECIESARGAIRANQEANGQLKRLHEEFIVSYVHWALIQAPFTPFMVLFCHVISTFSLSDLQLLGDFVDSLATPSQVSPAALKLYKLCQIFYNVAKLYVDAKAAERLAQVQAQAQAQASASNAQPVSTGLTQALEVDAFYAMEDFDPYLSALGMAPNTGWPVEDFGQGAVDENVTTAGYDTFKTIPNQQDWFSGSRYLMGLLEQDHDML